MAECVFDGDIFDYRLGLEPALNHIPNADNDRIDYNEITHAYAIAKYKDGGYNFVVLSKNQIERYRKLSQAQKAKSAPTGVWADHYEAMAKKTAIRRLQTYLPLSIEQMEQTALDEKIINMDAFKMNDKGAIEAKYEEFETPYALVDEETGEMKESAPAEQDNFADKPESVFGD